MVMFLEVSPLELELRGYSKEMAVLCGNHCVRNFSNTHEIHRFTDHDDCFILLYW